MTNLFAPLIKKNEIVTYFDAILIQADTKTQIFEQRPNFLKTLTKTKIKATPDETYFLLAAVKGLGYVIKNKMRPI